MIRLATAVIVALHLSLLLASLSDYRVTGDSAYHVAMGRQYAEHFVYFWDGVHYQPGGRPNLQGPAVHFAIGMLGRALGGTGDDYVQANAILGIAGWLAAMATVVFMARRYGSDRAALLAAAVFSGSAWASGSFYVNMPSGWMFVATPWAIHFFLQRRLVLATMATALACYTHLGGFATAPVGLIFAALLARRIRDLVTVGIGVTVFTSPYWVHFLRSLEWYTGEGGSPRRLIDPLVNLFGVVGFAAVLRAPRRHAFLLAWVLAPIAWIFQDTSRFILQSSLAGATLGGIAIAGWLEGCSSQRLKTVVTAALVSIATVFPLGVPGLGAELTWLAMPYPRILDWTEARGNADVIRRSGLENRLISGGGSALAVWSNVRLEKGHWVEVQPPVDPAMEMGVADRVYVVPIAADDGRLLKWRKEGWINVHGGDDRTSVLTFVRPPARLAALHVRNETWRREAAWIAHHCEHNTLGNWLTLFTDPDEIPRRRAIRNQCRSSVGSMQVGLLLWAYALEREKPKVARKARGYTHDLHQLSVILGSESALDFCNAAWHEQMRSHMAALARENGQDLDRAFYRLFEQVRECRRNGIFRWRRAPEPQL